MCGHAHREGVFLLKQVAKDIMLDCDVKDVDFMGYKKKKNDKFTFHHLIVPARYGGPYEYWNGVLLCGKTSHPYLHVIENVDIDVFNYITSLMIEEKNLSRIDLDILREIDKTLKKFEHKYETARFNNKKRVLKPEFLIRDYSSIK